MKVNLEPQKHSVHLYTLYKSWYPKSNYYTNKSIPVDMDKKNYPRLHNGTPDKTLQMESQFSQYQVVYKPAKTYQLLLHEVKALFVFAVYKYNASKDYLETVTATQPHAEVTFTSWGGSIYLG